MFDHEFNEIWDIISKGELTTQVRDDIRSKIEDLIRDAIDEALWYEHMGEDV